MADNRRDPTAAISFAVTAIAALTVALIGISSIATVVGSGSVMAFGRHASVCTTVQADKIGNRAGDRNQARLLGLRPATYSVTRTADLCLDHPSALDRLEASLGGMAQLLLLAGGLALTARVIKSARRVRLFTPGLASRIRLLGWYLIAGSLLAALLECVSEGLIVARATRDEAWTSGLSGFDMPWTLLLVGCGLLSMAGVLARAVVMQDELDAVI